jgi:hypothetical protein
VELSVGEGQDSVTEHKNDNHKNHPGPEEVQLYEDAQVFPHGHDENQDKDDDAGPGVAELAEVDGQVGRRVEFPVSSSDQVVKEEQVGE